MGPLTPPSSASFLHSIHHLPAWMDSVLLLFSPPSSPTSFSCGTPSTSWWFSILLLHHIAFRSTFLEFHCCCIPHTLVSSSFPLPAPHVVSSSLTFVTLSSLALGHFCSLFLSSSVLFLPPLFSPLPFCFSKLFFSISPFIQYLVLNLRLSDLHPPHPPYLPTSCHPL